MAVRTGVKAMTTLLPAATVVPVLPDAQARTLTRRVDGALRAPDPRPAQP
ncbi:hypothetical protein [Roseomonas sp. WA12]